MIAVVENSLQTVHLSVTSDCRRHCPMCHDRTVIPAHMAFDTALQLGRDAKALGIQTLAIGGGEPGWWPPINRFVEEAECGTIPKLAITTTMPQAFADRDNVELHVSWDEDHELGSYGYLEALVGIEITLKHKRTVGLNHVVTTREWLNKALKLPVRMILLLGRKPEVWNVPVWAIGAAKAARKIVLVDSCSMPPCKQVLWSLHIRWDGTVAQCSHVQVGRRPFEGLQSAWENRKPGVCPKERL